MRLIDADALSVKVEESKHKNPHGGLVRLKNEHNHFWRMINDAPTVDAVEVVRCKDCWKSADGLCSYLLKDVPGKDFCGDGERKSDAYV